MTNWRITHHIAEASSLNPRHPDGSSFHQVWRREAEIFAETVHRQMAMNAEPLHLTPAALYTLKDWLDKAGDEMLRRLDDEIRSLPSRPKPKPQKRKRP